MKKFAKRILAMTITIAVGISMGINVLFWISYIGCHLMGRSDLLQNNEDWINMMYLNLPILIFCWYAWLSDWNTCRLRKFMELDGENEDVQRL